MILRIWCFTDRAGVFRVEARCVVVLTGASRGVVCRLILALHSGL